MEIEESTPEGGTQRISLEETPPQDTAAMLRYLDPTSPLFEFINDIQGLEYDQFERKYVQNREPLFKEEAGVEWVIHLIKPFFSISAVANTLDQKEIKNMIDGLIEEIADTLSIESNETRFGFNSYDFELIGNKIWRFCYLNLKRSYKGGDRKLMATNVKTIQHQQTRIEHKARGGRGLFGIKNPLSKGK